MVTKLGVVIKHILKYSINSFENFSPDKKSAILDFVPEFSFHGRILLGNWGMSMKV